jgi:hypothetical protein
VATRVEAHEYRIARLYPIDFITNLLYDATACIYNSIKCGGLKVDRILLTFVTKNMRKFDRELAIQAGNISVAYTNGMNLNKCFVRPERVK